MDELLLALATLIQALAAFAALRQTPWRTHHLLAWGAISFALVLMTVRRLLPLMPLSAANEAAGATLQALLALLISVAALTGIIGLKRLFVELSEKDARLDERNRELQRLATTDPLTGILNRREFLRLVEAEMERGRRYGHPTAFVLFDLDHFKRVNDRCGHETGDQVLRAFCEVVTATVRANDQFGRLGGEEFALLLPESGAANGALMAERIRARAAALRFQHEGRPFGFTVSAGVAECDGSGAVEGADHLMRRADAALYSAKHRGRNRVERFCETGEVVADDGGGARAAR